MGAALDITNLQTAYEESPLSPTAHVDLTVAQGGIRFDGAALAAGEEDYFRVTRGATTVLTTAFDTVAARTVIKVGGVGGADFESTIIPDRATIRILLDQLEFLPQDRVLLANPGFLFGLNSEIGLNFVNATLGAFVRFTPTIQYHQNANPFGMGLLFNAAGIFENLPSGSSSLTTGLTYVSQNIYRANTNAITMIQLLDHLSQPRFQTTAGGTLTVSGLLGHFIARGNIESGVTYNGDRNCYRADDLSILTGTLNGENVGLRIADLTDGGGGAFGVQSVMTAAAGKRFIEHTGTAVSRIGGTVSLTGAALLDYGTSDALGGGAAATLGTIGGTGPTVAAQNTWLRVELAGVTGWIPMWI